MLAILPDGGSAAISDLLSRLGLPPEHHGDTTKLIELSIGDITRIVHQRKGLLIGAHCNSTHGVVEELNGQTRSDWIVALDALDINSESEDERISRTIDYVTNDLNISIPFTFGSDSHNASSATTGMWVKMAEPSFTCLRQLIFEPGLRVRRTAPAAPEHGRIVGFTTTHGIYARERFRFSPNLNVILGGRGAGKSAAIDLLRFAFQAEPTGDDESARVFKNRIAGFLQGVGEVLVAVVGTDGQTYIVTRSGAYELPSRRSIPIFSQTAHVYQIGDNTLIPREMRPLDLLGIEFYGQGEVAKLADRVDEQLRLIDENLDHSSATASIAEAEQQLEVDEKQLLEHKQRLEELLADAATRPQLEARRDRLNNSLEDPIFADRTRWDRERDWLQIQQDWVQAVLDSLPGSLPGRIDPPIDMKASPAKAVLEKVQETTDRVRRNGQTDLTAFRAKLLKAVSELAQYQTEWKTALAIGETQYRARLAELGAANLAQAAAEQRSLEEELARIGTIVEPEISQLRSKIALLETCRTQFLQTLRSSQSAITQARSEFVDQLNSSLSGNVMIDLSGINISLYIEAADRPLHGSRMMNREAQVLLACENLTPEEFVKALRSDSIDRLTAIGVTENNASRMKQTLTDGDLYKIERVNVPPLPVIRIKREGEANYTDLASLSVGEKCSAILSIALLSKGKPLVIDQPEDDLDHAFIIESIVEGIRAAKSERQIIAATHNPNIPVLGDAEMVFRVARQVGDDICHIKNSGGLELPQVTVEVQSLEGGAEAFERRRQRY